MLLSSNTGSSPQRMNLRELLGQDRHLLTTILVPLLSHRVETESLLPATQDALANEEVLNDNTNAMTLTLVCLQAAGLYAQLLSLPGAYLSYPLDRYFVEKTEVELGYEPDTVLLADC